MLMRSRRYAPTITARRACGGVFFIFCVQRRPHRAARPAAVWLFLLASIFLARNIETLFSTCQFVGHFICSTGAGLLPQQRRVSRLKRRTKKRNKDTDNFLSR
jgi:hypothetical protein